MPPINMCERIGKVLLIEGKIEHHHASVIYLVGKMFNNELYKTLEVAQRAREVEIPGLKHKQQQ